MWGLNFIRNINGNTKTIAKNAFYSFVIRGFALAISFFSTPAFIRYFQNNEVLGVWYTLLSILTWFLAFDLGVGNGIRNHLVIAIAEKKKENIKQILASGFASVIGITLILTIVGWWLICTINLNSLFNIPDNLISSEVLRKCTILVFIAIMMRFMLTTVSSIFYALQRSAVNSFLSLCVSILQFLFIIAFHYENVETALVNISWAYLLICDVPVIVAGIWVFFTDFKDCRPTIKSVTKEAAKKIMGIGLIFFFCQIFYLIIANTNEFFVSHYWSPTATADYSFYYRIIMLVSMGVSLALTPTWSMITKAYAEKNYHWLKNLYRSFQLVGYFIILAEFALVPFL